MLRRKFNDGSLKAPPDNNFQSYVSYSNNIIPDLNWKKDFQSDAETAQTYMNNAKKLRLAALLKIKEFLEKTPNAILKDDNTKNPGYYSLNGQDYHGLKTSSIDQLMDEIKADDESPAKIESLRKSLTLAAHQGDSKEIIRIGTELVTLKAKEPDTRFLKSEASVNRKINTEYTRDGVGHPEEIGDYLRFQILYETAEDIAHGRQALQKGETISLTAQKDRLRFPHVETSHRAFLARSLISDGDIKLKFEIMLSMVQAETFTYDKTLRDSSRACKQMAAKATSHVADYCAAAGVLDSVAQLSLCDLYEGIPNMNGMLDPSVNIKTIIDYAKSEFERNYEAGSTIVGKLPTARGQVAQMGRMLH